MSLSWGIPSMRGTDLLEGAAEVFRHWQRSEEEIRKSRGSEVREAKTQVEEKARQTTSARPS